ncbi:gamma tubulin complex Spc97/GCP2 subunit Alp4 [Podospora pseudoanserina]|uniref:Spindle pole body component n=1 Tax=Podospora pseudoanserina TaxID=2609844 RepID=A0ABR0ICU5_9PEZI|nr:gamma tubulin complex Spc97/GCP2 subunit Alp4 [Podospora pseudoanserina]
MAIVAFWGLEKLPRLGIGRAEVITILSPHICRPKVVVQHHFAIITAQQPNAGTGSRKRRTNTMSSGTTRPSTFQDKRSRPDQVSFSQSHSQHQQSNAESRKRSTSVNPRSTSRHVEERCTEKVQVTTRETLMTRTRSPDRREGAKQRAAEPRSRDMRQDAPPQEKKRKTRPHPWEPEATLLPHTTAPLASRISIPPLASTAPQTLQPKPFHDLSLEAQEAVIIEDLLFVFMGYEGQYIRFGKGYNPNEERDRLSGPTWRILPGLDPSLQDLTQSMLRMAAHYTALETFVDVQSREEFGSVNHALCASIRKLLQEYLVMVAQLETQFLTDDSFTLHVLNIHVLPTSHMMHQVYGLAHELLKRNALLDDESDESSDGGDDYDHILEQLREGGELVPGNMTGKKITKGGVVLGLITKRLESMSGDPAARALLTTLLRDASKPYMAMLNEWLHHGGINDPHSEFLIKEQRSIRRERLEQDYTDEYWERRYTIRDHDVPPQLEGVKDKVLLAGKYLNVVRECGGVDVSLQVKHVPTSFDDNRFLDNVNNAYAHANESLMQLLLTTHQLPARLRSLKHYFFLDPSDYFSYFLELGASELRKPVKSVNTGKLQSLLDLVLRQPGSIVALDPFKEDVKVEMNEINLTKSLHRVVNITGIEQGEALQPLTSNQPVESDKAANGFTSLQIDYSVPFPVSLVVSRKTVWRYQALFRYLLSLRYLESQLSTTWQTHTSGFVWCHRSSSRVLEIWKRRVWTLRARMLVFVQQLLYFCTAEVIEPNWQALMARVREREKPPQQEQQQQAGAGEQNGTTLPTPTTSPNLHHYPLKSTHIRPGLTRTVDELMQDHVDFLDTCLKECMLTNSKLLRIHSKLTQTCTIFATYTNWLSRELEKTDPDLSGHHRPPNMSEEQWRVFQSVRSQKPTDASFMEGQQQQQQQQGEDKMASLFDLIRKWEDNFSKHLQILLDALNHYAATETVVLLSLCARLSTANAGSGYTGRGGYGQGQVDGVGVQNGGGGMEGGDVRMGGV